MNNNQATIKVDTTIDNKDEESVERQLQEAFF